jgi:hypothetical protein
MPQGLSAGGSAFKPYLAINPCVWTWRHQAINILHQQMHHEVVGMRLVVEILQQEG